MFNTFLTTALEVVILLDLLGVIIYFIISGIVRAKKNPGGGSVAPPGVAPCPSGPSGYTAFPTDFSYVSSFPSPIVSSSGRGWLGLKGLKDRFTNRSGSKGIQSNDIEPEQRRIGMILNSFKEDV